jgi:hypothetical protein
VFDILFVMRLLMQLCSAVHLLSRIFAYYSLPVKLRHSIRTLGSAPGARTSSQHIPKYNMPSEWLTFRQRRMIEIVSGVAAHPMPFYFVTEQI